MYKDATIVDVNHRKEQVRVEVPVLYFKANLKAEVKEVVTMVMMGSEVDALVTVMHRLQDTRHDLSRRRPRHLDRLCHDHPLRGHPLQDHPRRDHSMLWHRPQDRGVLVTIILSRGIDFRIVIVDASAKNGCKSRPICAEELEWSR